VQAEAATALGARVSTAAKDRERRAAAAACVARGVRLRWDVEGHRAAYGCVAGLEEALLPALLSDAAGAGLLLLLPPAARVTLRHRAAAAAAADRDAAQGVCVQRVQPRVHQQPPFTGGGQKGQSTSVPTATRLKRELWAQGAGLAAPQPLVRPPPLRG
jgi:hypothetical protein